MKRIIYTLIVLITFQGVWLGCDEDDDFVDSIYDTTTPELNEVDKWIRTNYVKEYNIEVLYRWTDMETNLGYNLIPPAADTVVSFLRMVRHGWIKTYEDLVGADAIKPVFPKQILLLGSAGYNVNGTKILGTAEGGKKVILYELDKWNPADSAVVRDYMQILHHEFGHVLNQNKEYTIAYEEITSSNYSANWSNNSDETAQKLGFITAYAMASPDEDFVEMLSHYIMCSAAEWDGIISGISEDGRKKVLKKLDIVRTYMEDSWRIDIDSLRALVNQARKDILNGNF